MTTTQQVDRDTVLDYLDRMLLIRRFEERAAHLRSTGLIPGFLHPYIGQEAVAVGVCSALGPDDVLTSTHRGHGHLIARGADPARMYAELFARDGGYNRGKGGSLHMIDTALGFLGANGIVGGGIPIAAGAALQLRRAGKSAVGVTFFGDGASNEGVVPRDPQPRRALEASGPVRLREQPLRGVHPAGPAPGDHRRRRSGSLVRHGRRRGRRQRRPSRARGRR